MNLDIPTQPSNDTQVPGGPSQTQRTPKELLVASKAYAGETRWLSWWHLWSTLTVMCVLIGTTMSGLPLVVRIIASVLAGLVTVRLFIIYHDYQHHAILQNSWIAKLVMNIYGVLVLAPTSVWQDSHNDHHKTNSQVFGDNVGSYPIMTTEDYAKAKSSERFVYAASRHPLTIAFGYLTVFMWRMCLCDFLKNPKQHLDGGLAVVIHVALLIGLGSMGLDVMLLALVVPLFVGSALGSYLFYAQHNFPEAKMAAESEWSHVDAALKASSYIPMNPVLGWFTGNIGYHHIHHLNARIPFYRLPEAMAGLEELQTPPITTLFPKDIIACLRLKLWSEEQDRFVSFKGS
ncbi:MAG: fatty acid desaturase [Rubripirellula sp.]